MIYPINRKAMEKKEVRKVEVKVETRKQEPKRKVMRYFAEHRVTETQRCFLS